MNIKKEIENIFNNNNLVVACINYHRGETGMHIYEIICNRLLFYAEYAHGSGYIGKQKMLDYIEESIKDNFFNQ